MFDIVMAMVEVPTKLVFVIPLTISTVLDEAKQGVTVFIDPPGLPETEAVQFPGAMYISAGRVILTAAPAATPFLNVIEKV